MSKIKEMGKKAKEISFKLSKLETDKKNEVLIKVAKKLIENKNKIIEANKEDIRIGKENNVTEVMIERLMLDEDRILDMSNGLLELAELDDPIGEVLSMKKRPNGLVIGQKRTPLGVIGIIYESRPNVTVDGFGLCFKSGNAVILKGGKESIKTNIAIMKIIQDTLEDCGVSKNVAQLIESLDRKATMELMQMDEYVDVLIPRGSSRLIKVVLKNSTVPVIETGAGNCHVYIDSFADVSKVNPIVINAKTQRTGVCNALEHVLVHEDKLEEVIVPLYEKLIDSGVEVRADERARKFIPEAIATNDDDWGTEYLDMIISIKVVDSIDEAIEHINKYSTKHSDVILTEDYNNSNKFLDEINSAAVYINASTRFTDGSVFGLGAEIGISTQKLHATGPMGLKELTSKKYIIYGNGQIR